MKEEEMFREVIKLNNYTKISASEEIFLRKAIRKDMKEVLKIQRMTNLEGKTSDEEYEEDSDDQDMERKIEDKVQFGSDSDMDIDEFVNQRHEAYFAKLDELREKGLLAEYDAEEYYDEDGESEYEE